MTDATTPDVFASPEARARIEGWSERFVADTVQDRMKKIIAGKKPAKAKAPEEAPEPAGDNVVSIMDALKRSVAAEKRKR